MAKFGVTNISGGGGIGSDEVSATKDYVLSGKTYVGADTSDEIGIGTMDNNGTTGNQSINAGNTFLIKKGYHAQDFSVGANSLASQTSATAAASDMLSGKTAWVNGSKVTGSIPLQNADISGTDRARAVGMSNWAGTINLQVRNKYFLNGVNWIQQDIPNYRPENIKKGINIGGLIGTFEGYVPTPTDLYLRGNNIANFNTEVGFVYQSGQIDFDGTGYSTGSSEAIFCNNINLNGYSSVNILFSLTKADSSTKSLKLVIAQNGTSGISASTKLAYIEHPASEVVTDKIMSINVSQLQLVASISVVIYRYNSYSYKGNIKRIWLS